jgi:sec-independent protein translocase protein TatB
MFDIGFPELLLIGVVTLLVIGPDQLPSTMRTVALWIGRFRRGFADIRRDIEQGIGADEIRQQLHNEAILKEIERSKAAIAQTNAEIDNLAREAKSAMKSSEADGSADSGSEPKTPSPNERSTREP